jgi:predicted dehydrogenase
MWHTVAGTTEEIVFPVCDQYTIQGDLFSLAVINDTPVPTPMSDAVSNMRVIDAIVSSNATQAWVTL